MKLSKILTQVRKDNSGATAVEYGLIISLVILACMSAIASVADETNAMWDEVSDKTGAVMN